MIIELLCSLFMRLAETLFFFSIPNFSDEVLSYIETLVSYLESGASLLANYVPLTYLMYLFGIVLAVDIAVNIYKFVMWVLNKIPMLAID